jgi:hypothetical protein
MKSLSEIQAEIQEWAKQFGTNISRDEDSMSYACSLDSLVPLLGMVEEIGELCHVTIYRHQGRGFTVEEARAARIDAVADLLVFMCDYATREGINLTEALNQVWEKVQYRRRDSWKKDKQVEKQVEHTDWFEAGPPSPLIPAPELDESRRGKVAKEALEEYMTAARGSVVMMGGEDKIDTRSFHDIEEARIRWANNDLNTSHQWDKVQDGRVRANARCLKCGAYANLGSGFMECPARVVATEEPLYSEDGQTSVVIVGCAGGSGVMNAVCAHCHRRGVVPCAWST